MDPIDDAFDKAMAILMEHADNVAIITQTGSEYPTYDFGGNFYAIKGAIDHVNKYLEVNSDDELCEVEDDDHPEWLNDFDECEEEDDE